MFYFFFCFFSGGNFVKVWDVLSGGKLLAAFSNHQKTVTALGFDGSGQRLFSGGLDKCVRAPVPVATCSYVS